MPQPTNRRSILPLALCVVLIVAGCAIQQGQSIPVTRESIGNLRLDRPIQELRKLSPNAVDTIVEEHESTWPGVVFRFPDLIVVAAQHRDQLDPTLPADSWTLIGCGARLPQDVPVCANWQELTRVFGDSGVSTSEGGPAVVRLCGLEGFEFELDISSETVGREGSSGDLSRIPSSARIERVTLWRGGPPGRSGCT